MKKLDIIATISDGVKFGVKNILALLITMVLYALTCWIPYLNVGTTVGLVKFIISMSQGTVADPLILFDKSNFDNLGNLFLFLGLMTMGLLIASLFFIVPAIILGIAWGYALYFLVDRNMKPIEALELSFKATDGEKWRILAVQLIVVIAMIVVISLFAIIPEVGPYLAIVADIFCTAIVLAVESVLFKHFSEKAGAVNAEIPAEPVSE